MECPHCQKEIPGKPCPHCGAEVPAESRYCMDCGGPFEDNEIPETIDQGDPFDIDSRVLCPDGTCTGIMVDGKCTECGRSPEEIRAAQEPEDEASRPEEAESTPTP